MKKSILTIAAVCLALCGFAQEKKFTLKPYGFVRNYAAYDSRANLSSNSDQFNTCYCHLPGNHPSVCDSYMTVV